MCVIFLIVVTLGHRGPIKKYLDIEKEHIFDILFF